MVRSQHLWCFLYAIVKGRRVGVFKITPLPPIAMGKFITIVTLPPASVTNCPLRLWNFPEDEVYVIWRMYRPYKQADLVNKPSYQLSTNNIQKPGKRETVGFFFITFTLFRAAGREKQTHTQNALLKSCGRITLFHFPHICVIVRTAIFEAAASGYQPESLSYNRKIIPSNSRC